MRGRGLPGGRGARAVLAGGVMAILFVVAASASVSVSPAGTHSASHQYQYDKKKTICHRTGSKKHPFVTIRVARRAVRRHLRHGDKLGPCSRAKFVVCHKGRRGKQTIKVRGVRSLKEHLRHGDRLGSCRRGDDDRKDRKKSDRGKRR
jgi:hypothetical protein